MKSSKRELWIIRTYYYNIWWAIVFKKLNWCHSLHVGKIDLIQFFSISIFLWESTKLKVSHLLIASNQKIVIHSFLNTALQMFHSKTHWSENNLLTKLLSYWSLFCTELKIGNDQLAIFLAINIIFSGPSIFNFDTNANKYYNLKLTSLTGHGIILA